MQPWIQLERDLWLFTDGKLYWHDSQRTSEALIAGSGNFPAEVDRATSTERKWWLSAIENWQANNDQARASGDPLYQRASQYACQIKAIR